MTVTPVLSVGGNYTYLNRHLKDPNNPAFRPTGTPTHKLFAYADFRALPRLTITPSLELSGNRWTATSNGARYYRTGRAALANLGVSFAVTDSVELTANARNLFDNRFQLVDGYPEEGRSVQVAARLRL